MKVIFLTTMVAAAFLVFSAPSAAQNVGGATCATPGTVALPNIPPKKDDLVPSIGSQIAGYGRQAKASNCLIDLVCVAANNTDAARDIANKQCVVVRDRLVKAGFTKANIDTSRKLPGNGRVAGMVYFTVH